MLDDFTNNTNKSELELARENLNSYPITASQEYDGVTVSVHAPTESFPEHTELKISPVEGSQLEDIYQQILGYNSEVLSDGLVAFDIQFIYKLSDGSQIKLQPNENVEVRFDYSGKNELKDADARELKVYHIADKNTEVQNETTSVMTKKLKLRSSAKSVLAKGLEEMVISQKGNELVVNATKFSIYAIIKTNIPQSVTVNYRAGAGAFSGGVDMVTITYTLNNGDYVADKATQQPNKDGYSFKGWYTSDACTTRWNGIVDDTTSTEMTVYACYIPFSDKTLTFGRFSFTMMDRNLGAENINDYGYLYQWGNNYGFDSGDTPAISIDMVKTNTYDGQGRGPQNYYSSSNFIARQESPFRWDFADNRNIWGGTSTNQLDWQGPCPEGYHVPNSVEWKAVYDSYIKSGHQSKNFGSGLGLPMAGYRNPKLAGVLNSQGEYGWYWASNAYNNTESAYTLTFSDSSANPTDNKYRSYANSIRCFKNTDLITISFDTNGGDSLDDMKFKRYEPRTKALMPTPTKAGESFAGWFYDSSFTQPFVWANDTYVTDDTILYAKWGCEMGYVISGSECVLRNVTVTYKIGDTIYKTAIYNRNISGHYMSKTQIQPPLTGAGYYFDQWYLDQNFTQLWEYPMDTDGLGEDVTVYGRFLPFEDMVVDFGDIQITIMDRNLGATSTSNGGGDATDDNIGYYYQYGNNYGFPNVGVWRNTTSEQLTNISSAITPTNMYSNGLFVTNRDRYFIYNNRYPNNWGGYDSYTQKSHVNIDSLKVGPCPTGYHIPERNEWKFTYTKFQTWKSTPDGQVYCNGLGEGACFAKLMGMPYGGYRSHISSDVENQSDFGIYHTSTYRNYETRYVLQLNDTTISTSRIYNWTDAYSVRCFKDTPRYVLRFDAKGGSTPAIQYIWRRNPYSPQASSRYGSVFSGWYYDTGYLNKFEGVMTEDTTVYARWECKEGFRMNDAGVCETDQTISVTFVANPDTFPEGKFSDNTSQKTIQYKGKPAGYYVALNQEIQIPELSKSGTTGYMFEGWYTDTTYTDSARWTGLSLNTDYTSITLYARYLPFQDKTISLDGVTFTIMDRNLGATKSISGYGFGADNSPVESVGNYYQWGNNFGFPTTTNVIYNVLVERDASNPERGPGNYYFNGVFISTSEAPRYWNSGAIARENLWGGGGTSLSDGQYHPDSDKQGPCPAGYHVPYSIEWNSTMFIFQRWMQTDEGSAYCNSIHATNTDIQYCMPAVLGLPYAGLISRAGYISTVIGERSHYWSSNSSRSGYANNLGFDANVINVGETIRTNGFSIRCFKDSPYLTLAFDSNGGSNVTSQTNFRWWQARHVKPTNPTRANSDFVGWFTDEELTKEFSFSTTTFVSEDTTLHAKWTCKDGYSMSADGQRCESASVVTFNATTNGGTTSRPVAGFKSGDMVRLSDYTASKPGWEFVGWNTSQIAREAMDDFVIGNNGVRVYAIFKKEVTATFDKNGNDSQSSDGSTYTDLVKKSCQIRNAQTSCDVISPTISSSVTRRILGYSNSATNHVGTYGVNSSISISADTTFFAQTTTDPVDRLITFNPNGNASFTYGSDTQTTAKDYVLCTIPATYNGVAQSDSCSETITFPTITPNGEKTVLGWSTGANVQNNLIATGASQRLTANKNLAYYAQSQSDGKTFTVTFYGNGASVSGANSYQETCNIAPEFNGGVQATECDVAIPTITRAGFSILGYSTDENAQTATIPTLQTVLTLTADTSLYAISKKDISVKFYKNGNDSQTRDGQSVADTSEYVSESCAVRNGATSCSVQTPVVSSVNTPSILGYSTSANDHTAIVAQDSSLSVSDSVSYYAQSMRDSQTFKMSFYLNGNVGYTYDSTNYTADSVHTLCTIDAVYNGVQQPSECSISINFPMISAPTNTPTVLGWSDSNTNHSPQYTAGQTANISAGSDQYYFAQTMKDAITLTGIFQKGTGADTLSYDSTTCTIHPIYNGNDGNPQSTYCDIAFPTFTLRPGYKNPVWSSTIGEWNANTTTYLSISENVAFRLVSDEDESAYIQYLVNYKKENIYDTGYDAQYTQTYTGYGLAGKTATIPVRVYDGFTLSGDYADYQTTIASDGSTVIDIFYHRNKYTITYDPNNGENVVSFEAKYEKPISRPVDPSKTGYSFAGWEPDFPDSVPLNGANVVAKWTPDVISDAGSKWGYSGRGGRSVNSGHNSADDENVSDNDNNLYAQDNESDSKSGDTSDYDHSDNAAISLSKLVITDEDRSRYSQEVIDAYEWAYGYDITTINTFNKSMPNKYLIRGHLAKMAVNYAVNVLGKEMPSHIPDDCQWGDDESVWGNAEIKDYAQKACALGIMGIKVKKFDPKKIVSRAEFGTVLSRLLWGDRYDLSNPTKKNPYYVNHLQALKNLGIMNDISDPVKRNELRERVRVMLKRASSIVN